MQFMKIWIIVSTIAEILSYCVCQTQLQNNNESNFNQESKITQIQQNTTKLKNYDLSHINSTFISSVYFGDIFSDCMKTFVPFSNVNKNCTKDGQHFLKEFRNQSTWAVQMYDSSAKYPGGVLFGEVTELGNFDQCMSVISEKFRIHGAYAVVNIQFRLIDNYIESSSTDFVRAYRERSKRNMLMAGPETILWAVCVPDSCTADNIRQSVEHVLNQTFRTHNVAIDVSVPPSLYTSKKTMLESSVGGLALTYGILSLSVLMAVVGTLYGFFSDLSNIENDGLFRKCLKSYSIINNTKLLLTNSKNDKLAIISGFKLIGMFGVIIGHRVVLVLTAPTISHEFIKHIYEDYSMGFLRTPIIVEIFFVISGFLTCVMTDDHLRNGKPFEFFNLLFHRLCRILPMYITVLLIFSNILPYIGDGPMWKHFIYPEAEYCRKNWWTNLLFINNYVNTYEMCMFNSWYLACDMHFFIVGTLLIYIIYRWKKIGQYIFSILLLLSIYMPAKHIYDYKQWGVMPYFPSTLRNVRRAEHFHSMYIKSHFRITTYLIGIGAAYTYLHIKKNKIHFSMAKRVVGFSLSSIVSCICITSITGYLYLSSETYKPWDHILYFTLLRIVFALSVSYTLVVMLISNFGFVNSIFNNKFNLVVARLSYIVYLVHLIGMLNSEGQLRQPQYENYWTVFLKISTDAISTIAIAIPLNTIIETPSRNVINIILKNVQKSNNNLNSNDNEIKLD